MAFVQAAGDGGHGGTSTFTQAYSSNITAGNTCLAAVSFDDSGGTIPISSVTDTLGNTYTLVDEIARGEHIAIYVAPSPSGGANTVTVSFTGGSPGDGALAVAEFSGRDTSTPIGNHTTNDQVTPGNSTDGVTVGPITVVAGDDIVSWHVDYFSGIPGGTEYTAGTGFTSAVQTGGIDGLLQYKENVSAGSITATATAADATNSTVSIVVALNASGGGGGTVGRLVGGTLCGGVLVGGLLTGL